MEGIQRRGKIGIARGLLILLLISLPSFALATTYGGSNYNAGTYGNGGTEPVISSISSGTPGQTSATITWTTDEGASSQVSYGTTGAYGSATSSASLATSHSIGVIGLVASTTYHYAIVSTDAQGNTATSSDQTFTTASIPTATPPVISSISSGTPGQTSATITWMTDVLANSQVAYGTTSAYGATTTLDSTLVASHSVTLTGLSTNTTFHFQIITINASSSVATSSDEMFTTAAAPVASGGGGGGGGGGPVAGSIGSGSLVNLNAVPPGVATSSASSTVLQTAGSGQAASFARDLTLGTRGSDVMLLQIYLNAHGFPVAEAGPGSAGEETTYFGVGTQAALAKFQAANKISPALGYFGPKTRTIVSLYEEVAALMAEIAALEAATSK